MTTNETIDGLQEIIDRNQKNILPRVHIGYLIHAVKYLKEQKEEIENLKQLAQSMMEGICLLKEQEAVLQKMWNAFYDEEDKFEKKYAGTKENNSWFLIYRPWLQRGFEIAVETIVKQEGR